MFKRLVAYRRKRELAHKILFELLPEKDSEDYKKVGLQYFVTDQEGRTFIQDERMGFFKLQRGYIGFSSLKIILKQYSELEIKEALNLLISYGHIEIESQVQLKSIDQVSFAISPKGRLAYDDRFYQNQLRWSEMIPVLDKFRTGVITALFSLTVGITLWSLSSRKQGQVDSQQDKRLNSLSDSVSILQKRIDNLPKHK